MTDTGRRRRGLFALLLDAGIFVTGVVRGLLVKRPVTTGVEWNAGLEQAPGSETEQHIASEPSDREAEPETEIASSRLPAHFTIRPHWHEPRPDAIPALTYAPATMALGIVLFALGLITRWYIALVGGLIFARAIWMWVGDLTDERSDRNLDGL